jgi:hypothetical protein
MKAISCSIALFIEAEKSAPYIFRTMRNFLYNSTNNLLAVRPSLNLMNCFGKILFECCSLPE